MPIDEKNLPVDQYKTLGINVMTCASAAGKLMPPAICYPGQRFTFQPQEDFPEANVSKTLKGMITGAACRKWLKETFIPRIKVILSFLITQVMV